MTAKPARNNNTKFEFSFEKVILPVLLFLGAGLVDTTIKLAQHFYMNDDNRNVVIMSIFGFAALFGTLKLIYDRFHLKKPVLFRSIAGGILLGVVNYFSLYFLVKCLGMPGAESSTVFAIVNIGVVLLSFVLGLMLFREYITRIKITGIILAIIAIILLSAS